MHPLVARIQQAIITLFVAITLGFVLIHQLPTGPWQILTAVYSQEQLQGMDPEQIEQISETFMGFSASEPIHVQYVQYFSSVLQGDFGTSVLYQEPVFSVLAPAVPWTVLMATLAMVANTIIGLTAGAYMAYRQGSRFDVGGTFVSVLLSAIPYYVFAILLLFFLGYQTTLFPNSGRYANDVTVGYNLEFMLSALHHVALPFMSLVFSSFAALGLRAHCIRILGSDYIRVARLRGLAERRIVFHYVLRNSFLPFYTGFVVGLVGIFGGSVITEYIFQYVGVGWYLFAAAEGGDIPLVLGGFLFFTTAVVLALLVVDLTYSVVDPRAEGVGADETF